MRVSTGRVPRKDVCTHGRGELDVNGVRREVNDGAVAADVEDRVVALVADLGELLRGRELLLHHGVLEELHVAGEHLHTALVDGRVGTGRRGEVNLVLGREDWRVLISR